MSSWLNKVERELGLDRLELPVEPIKENETFLCVERTLLVHVENELSKAATPQLLQLSEYRLSRFWADVIPAIQARWALICSAAELLIQASRVGKALKTAPTTVPLSSKPTPTMMNRGACSTRTTGTWRAVNTTLISAPVMSMTDLDKLISKAEQRYTEIGSDWRSTSSPTFKRPRIRSKVCSGSEIFLKSR